MDNSFLIERLFELVSKGVLRKEQKLVFKKKGKELKENDFVEKELSFTYFYVPFKLESGEILLVKDISLNFFLAYSLLIGEHTKLISFSLEGYKERFILPEKELNEFPLEISEKEKFDTKMLYLKSFSTPFEEIPFLFQLKEEIEETQELNLSQIHFVKGEELKLFLPTVHSAHLELAKKLKIALFPLFDGHFIRSTGLHIYDLAKQEELLNALSSVKKKEKWPCDTTEHTLLFKDLKEELILEFNEEYLKEKEYYELLTPFLPLLKKKKKSKIGEFGASSFLLPLWSSSLHPLFSFQNIQDYEELSGRSFRNNVFLSQLYLQDEHGKKLHFLNFSFSSELIEYFKDLNSSELVYHSQEELFFKVFFSKEIHSIKEELQIKKAEEKELQKHAQALLKLLSKLVAQHKGEIGSSSQDSFVSRVLAQLCFECEWMQESFQNKELSPEELLVFLREKLIFLHDFCSSFPCEEDLENSLQLFLKLLELAQILTTELLEKEREEFFSLFKNLKKRVFKQSSTQEEVRLLFHCVEAQKLLDNKEEVLFLLLSKDFDLPSLGKKVPFSRKEPKGKSFLKPNREFIEKRYPYLVKELMEKLSRIQKAELPQRVLLKNRTLLIDSSFFKEHKVYENYHILEREKAYELLLKKTDKKS